jgi:hypothetical protein
MKKHIFNMPLPATIDANELLRMAEKEVDPRAPQTLMALADPLYRLAQDKGLLQKYINLGLSNWKRGYFHFYSPQSCQIASLGDFVIRINLWPLLPADPRRRAILADILSYFDYHDHNFSFITANYFGPGYETRLYCYERANMIGFPSEKVELESLGTHCLDDKTVMLYEEFHDVHTQLPPASLSASINLMLAGKGSGLTNQHFFDPEHGRILGYVGSFSHKRVNALGFARHFHDEETLMLLHEILESHECSRTRVEAGKVLVALMGEAAVSAEGKKKMLRDPLARALWSGASHA